MLLIRLLLLFRQWRQMVEWNLLQLSILGEVEKERKGKAWQ
jgi:hypothetical protein